MLSYGCQYPFQSVPQALADAVALLERRHAPEQDTGPPAPCGPHRLLLPGLHEWFPAAQPAAARTLWLPPLGALIHVARHTLASHGGRTAPLMLWIGRRCWPYPRALARTHDASPGLLARSVFVDPPGRAERAWAVEQALRSPAVACVVADGSTLRMPESRRLQLAAAAGNALCLLARPPWEHTELSAARTRWRVTPARAADDNGYAWTLELLRCKGLPPLTEHAHRWRVCHDHETDPLTGDVGVDADVSDRSSAPMRPAPATRRTA